jgi:choline dehydrogenase
MGVSSSKLHSDPTQFATSVSEAAPGFQPEKKSWKTYDYIICGGGTSFPPLWNNCSSEFLIGAAGCVLASRLSENPEISVLLIEAGKTWVLCSV